MWNYSNLKTIEKISSKTKCIAKLLLSKVPFKKTNKKHRK